MPVRVMPIRLLAASSLLIAGTMPAFAQIAAKSPFMPPQSASNAGPTPGAPLQFGGFIETSEGMQYRIVDPAKKTGVWVKLNEKNAEFDVLAKQHDEGQQTLTIEYQGKTLTLEERRPKVVSSGAAAAAVPPPVAIPAQTNVPPAVTQAVVLNPTPADEQRRLDAVAAEVARRRAMREQATQQITQGNAPQVAVPQPAQVQQQVVPQRIPQPGQPVYQQQGPAAGAPRGRGPQPNTR
jgi:hypothetical protein